MVIFHSFSFLLGGHAIDVGGPIKHLDAPTDCAVVGLAPVHVYLEDGHQRTPGFVCVFPLHI